MTPIVRAVARAKESVVNIHGEKTVAEENQLGSERRVNGMGTGIVIDPRGYILTNYHVVKGVEEIETTLADGSEHVARLVARDPKTDSGGDQSRRRPRSFRSSTGERPRTSCRARRSSRSETPTVTPTP